MPTRLSPYQCYCTYVALKNHFTSDYDFFRYNAQTRSLSPKTFVARRDRDQFEKLARHSDPFHLMLANLSHNSFFWVGDFMSREGKQLYENWNKRTQALSYYFSEDLAYLAPDFNANFVVQKGEHPHLIKLYLANKIAVETLIILVDLAGCYTTWNKKMNADDVIWQEVSRKIVKYRPFMTKERDNFKKILLTHLTAPVK